jgi:hypothetical protein
MTDVNIAGIKPAGIVRVSGDLDFQPVVGIRSVNPCAAQPRARAAAHWSGNNSASRFCG